MRRLTAIVAFVIAGALVLHAADPYHLIKEIPIGGEGGWDYMTVDPAAHRPYVSHATKVLVADIDSGKVVGGNRRQNEGMRVLLVEDEPNAAHLIPMATADCLLRTAYRLNVVAPSLPALPTFS